MPPIKCYVYKGRGRTETYLYLRSRDDFSEVPESVLRHFGSLELVLEFDLTPDRALAKEEPAEVYSNLLHRGFHIQMPDDRGRLEAELSKLH